MIYATNKSMEHMKLYTVVGTVHFTHREGKDKGYAVTRQVPSFLVIARTEQDALIQGNSIILTSYPYDSLQGDDSITVDVCRYYSSVTHDPIDNNL